MRIYIFIYFIQIILPSSLHQCIELPPPMFTESIPLGIPVAPTLTPLLWAAFLTYTPFELVVKDSLL